MFNDKTVLTTLLQGRINSVSVWEIYLKTLKLFATNVWEKNIGKGDFISINFD